MDEFTTFFSPHFLAFLLVTGRRRSFLNRHPTGLEPRVALKILCSTKRMFAKDLKTHLKGPGSKSSELDAECGPDTLLGYVNHHSDSNTVLTQGQKTMCTN